MKSDFVSIIGNLSQSLVPVQTLITGLGYMTGIVFMIIAISKFKKIGDFRARGGSQEKMFVPIAYVLGGSALIFLPSAVTILSNSAFGVGNNVLEYSQYNPYNVYNSVRTIIKTAGLIWFVRGSVLLAHASEPSVKEGPKGLAFLVAGILAINFEGTVSILNDTMHTLMNFSLPFGPGSGTSSSSDSSSLPSE